MKIKVDRVNSLDGDLIFMITVSEPHHASFDETDLSVMRELEKCKEQVEKLSPEESKLRMDTVSLIHLAKEKTFKRIINSLTFAIKEELEPKFRPICQEIFNWIHDQQKDCVKTWMDEFNPERTKYYFDNDGKFNSNSLGYFSEDKFDDEEFDDDDDED